MVEVNRQLVNCSPWSVIRSAGIPNQEIQLLMKHSVMVSALMLEIGIASSHRENLSIIVKMYLFLELVVSNGPTMSQ